MVCGEVWYIRNQQEKVFPTSSIQLKMDKTKGNILSSKKIIGLQILAIYYRISSIWSFQSHSKI